jgi:hypothetical protein
MKATTPASPAQERFGPLAPLQDSTESPRLSDQLNGLELFVEGNTKGTASLDDAAEPVSFFERPLPGEVLPETKQIPEASDDSQQVRNRQSAEHC